MTQDEHSGFAKELFWWLMFGVAMFAFVVLCIPFIVGLV